MSIVLAGPPEKTSKGFRGFFALKTAASFAIVGKIKKLTELL